MYIYSTLLHFLKKRKFHFVCRIEYADTPLLGMNEFEKEGFVCVGGGGEGEGEGRRGKGRGKVRRGEERRGLGILCQSESIGKGKGRERVLFVGWVGLIRGLLKVIDIVKGE